MTKKHHPHTRAERLALKQDAYIQHTKPKPTHAKKKLKGELYDQETKAELTRAARLHEYGTD